MSDFQRDLGSVAPAARPIVDDVVEDWIGAENSLANGSMTWPEYAQRLSSASQVMAARLPLLREALRNPVPQTGNQQPTVAINSGPTTNPAAEMSQSNSSGCETFEKPNINDAKIHAAIVAAQKGEYEKSEESEARINKLFPEFALVAVTDSASLAGRYDADREILSFPKGKLFFGLFGEREIVTLDPRYDGFSIASNTNQIGKYVGQNSYGAKAVVSEEVASEFGMLWKKRGPSPNPRNDIEISLPLKIIRQTRPFLRFMVKGTLEKPYVLSERNYSGATISNPTDFVFKTEAVTFTPRCAAVFDSRTNKVLASWGAS